MTTEQTPPKRKMTPAERMAKARAASKMPQSEKSRRGWETRRNKAAAEAMGLSLEQYSIGGAKVLELTQQAVVAHASRIFKTSAGKAAALLVKVVEDDTVRPEVRVTAAKEILDRALGRAVQTNLVGSMDGEVVTLGRDQILAAARRVLTVSAIDIEPRDDHPDAA